MRKYFELDQFFITSSSENNTLKIIDSIGLFILESLDAGVTEEELSKEISDIFTLPIKQARSDISLFLYQYNKVGRVNTSPFPHIEKRKVTLIAPSNYVQIAKFPTFSLKISHEYYDSYVMTRSFFQHLEIPISKSFIADYHLIIQKNEMKYWEIIQDKEILFTGERLDKIIVPAISYILELAIRKDPYLILLHASGVAYNNKSIIFPAIGGSGKSTLCAALIKRGFTYINDDVIPVAYDSGELLSIPFCLGVKQGSWSVLEKYYPNIAECHEFERNGLKIKYLSPPAKLFPKKTFKTNFLVIPCYEKGISCSLVRVSSVDGLRAIIEGESLIKLPLKDDDIEYLVEWVENIHCYKLVYSNLEEAITTLKETLFIK